MTFDARVSALAEAVADAADTDSERWRALYEADHEATIRAPGWRSGARRATR